MGIEILAELGSLRLQETDDAVAGEVAGAVEGQVLQEVGQSLLVVALVNGTGLDKQPIDGLSTRVLVRVHVVGQPVVEPAFPQLRVVA